MTFGNMNLIPDPVNTRSHPPSRAMPVYKGSAADSSVLPPPHLSISNVQPMGDGFCKMQPSAASENVFLNDSDDDSDSNWAANMQ
jgi:hypothetical protein